MGFFYNDTRDDKPKRSTAPPKARLEDIPVTILRERSCSVCPRDKDTALRSPKLRPEGPSDGRVYLLGGSPNRSDDYQDRHWTNGNMPVMLDLFRDSFMQSRSAQQLRGAVHG
jgi:hypothetical protein